MENNENKNLQNRREFFKEAARKALPIFGFIALMSNPMIASAVGNEPMGCDGACKSNCVGGCRGRCQSGCRTDCKENCKGQTSAFGDDKNCRDCKNFCFGCQGYCQGSCKGSCSRNSSIG